MLVGAQPSARVEEFLDVLVPSEPDALVEAGDETALRTALELEPGRADSAVALARLVHGRGDDEEALEVLGNVAGSFAADGLAARIPARGRARPARRFAALDAGGSERGLDGLIEAIPANGDVQREDVRRAVVGVLDELGVEDPLARESRRKPGIALHWKGSRPTRHSVSSDGPLGTLWNAEVPGAKIAPGTCVWRCPPLGSGGRGRQLLALDVDLGQHAPETLGHPPGPLAQQRHHGRHHGHADDECVGQHAEGE